MAWETPCVVDHIQFKLIFFPMPRICFVWLYKRLALHILLEAVRTEILKCYLNLGDTFFFIRSKWTLSKISEYPEIPQELCWAGYYNDH